MRMLLSANDISALRRSMGLTLRDFGERIGVSEATVSRWEGETRFPDYHNLVALSKLAEAHELEKRPTRNGHAKRQLVGSGAK